MLKTALIVNLQGYVRNRRTAQVRANVENRGDGLRYNIVAFREHERGKWIKPLDKRELGYDEFLGAMTKDGWREKHPATRIVGSELFFDLERVKV